MRKDGGMAFSLDSGSKIITLIIVTNLKHSCCVTTRSLYFAQVRANVTREIKLVENWLKIVSGK